MATEADLRAEDRALADHERWYADVAARMREAVATTVPEGARVAVISKGDDELLRLGAREGRHFPQSETGLFAGHYPADGAEAVAHLDRARARGAQYLVIPEPARWWLDHYGELRAHLDEHASLLADDDSCVVFGLGGGTPEAATPASDLDVAQVAPTVGAWLAALLPDDAPVAAVGRAAAALDLGGRRVWRLPEPDAAQLDAALSAGAEYVVLLVPQDRPARAGMEALRRGLVRRGRLVAGQALADVFHVSPRAGRPRPHPRRGLFQLFRDRHGRSDAET